jgi:hypothetical protein
MMNQEISRREHSLCLELGDDTESGLRNPGRVHRIAHPSGSLSRKGMGLIGWAGEERPTSDRERREAIAAAGVAVA